MISYPFLSVYDYMFTEQERFTVIHEINLEICYIDRLQSSL